MRGEQHTRREHFMHQDVVGHGRGHREAVAAAASHDGLTTSGARACAASHDPWPDTPSSSMAMELIAADSSAAVPALLCYNHRCCMTDDEAATPS